MIAGNQSIALMAGKGWVGMIKINKMYKIEEVISKEKSKERWSFIYFDKSGESTSAVATDGTMLAIVPCEVESGELERGNSIKGSDLKFQRQNPAVKKQEYVFANLEPLGHDFVDYKKVIPTTQAAISISLDIDKLLSLSKALGTSEVTLKIHGIDKTIEVVPYALDNKAYGILLPLRPHK